MWEEEDEEEEEEVETSPEDAAETAEGETEKKVKNEKEVETESDSPLLEITDNLEQLENLPIYKSDRAVSVTSLKPFTGFICELCDRTFETQELSQVYVHMAFFSVRYLNVLYFSLESLENQNSLLCIC